MPGRVSIVDAQGNLLASGAGTGEGALAGSAEERRIALENRIKGQIEQILAGIVRPQGLRVTVNAEMDFNRTVTESQIYDPDRQVIAETSTVEEISNARDSRPGGAVSASEELPDTNGAGTDGEAGTSESSNRTEERTQFRSSLTKTTEVEEGGRLERLSVAVAVDGAREAAEDGTTTWTPRTEEEMAQITALVRTAMGFDRRRGDQLEVTNMRFEAPPVLDAAPVEEPLIQLDKTDYMRIAELAVLAVMALILVLFVFRPILKQLMTRPTEQQAGQQALTSENLPQLAPPAEGQVANQNQPGAIAQTGGGAAQALPGPGGDNDVSRAIDIAQVQGQVKESSIKKVGEIVTHHPEESMAILRSWLHQSS
jgi:flagellar M-ring protein FliF